MVYSPEEIAAIAAKLAQDGNSVLVLDLDQNQTVGRWAKKAAMPGLEVMALGGEAFTRVFRDKAERFDHVLIDLAGTREALPFRDGTDGAFAAKIVRKG
jgi:chromosome partitioning protein